MLHAFEQSAQSDLPLQPRERGTQAVVNALPEGQVAVFLAPEVEPLRLVELRFVPVGGRDQAIDQRSGGNRDTGDLDRLARVAFGGDLDRAVEAQQLLHRGCLELPVGASGTRSRRGSRVV